MTQAKNPVFRVWRPLILASLNHEILGVEAPSARHTLLLGTNEQGQWGIHRHLKCLGCRHSCACQEAAALAAELWLALSCPKVEAPRAVDPVGASLRGSASDLGMAVWTEALNIQRQPWRLSKTSFTMSHGQNSLYTAWQPFNQDTK